MRPGCILRTDNLMRRKKIIIDRCVLCGKDEESYNLCSFGVKLQYSYELKLLEAFDAIIL